MTICRVHDPDDPMPGRICGRPLPCREHDRETGVLVYAGMDGGDNRGPVPHDIHEAEQRVIASARILARIMLREPELGNIAEKCLLLEVRRLGMAIDREEQER
jgi:hypothetical protein